MSTENIVKNKYYRILKDKTNAIWDRISFWTHADDVELTNGTTLSYDLSDKDAKITGTQSDFAQVETSPTTHAYVKGQMLIYNNQTYRVIAAIAVGNTLTVGTNIEPISVSTLSSMLTASDGKQFYLDVKDGSYGFYPSASKTPSEFVPFGGTAIPNNFYFDCVSMTLQSFQPDTWVSKLKDNRALINSSGYTKIDVRKMYYGSLDPSGVITVQGIKDGVSTTIINLPANSGSQASSNISSYAFLIYYGYYDGNGPMYYDFKLS